MQPSSDLEQTEGPRTASVSNIEPISLTESARQDMQDEGELSSSPYRSRERGLLA